MPAFVDIWDVATPAGTDLRSQGDDRFRELKRAFLERYLVEHDFPVAAGAGSGRHKFARGNTASRPTDPSTGTIYINTQTLALEVWDGAAWQTAAVQSDATKLPLAGGTMSGNINMGGNQFSNVQANSFPNSALSYKIREGATLYTGSGTLGGDVTLTGSYQTIVSGGSFTILTGITTAFVMIFCTYFVNISGSPDSTTTVTYKFRRSGTDIFTSGASGALSTSVTGKTQISVAFFDTLTTTGAKSYDIQMVQAGPGTIKIQAPSHIFYDAKVN